MTWITKILQYLLWKNYFFVGVIFELGVWNIEKITVEQVNMLWKEILVSTRATILGHQFFPQQLGFLKVQWYYNCNGSHATCCLHMLLAATGCYSPHPFCLLLCSHTAIQRYSLPFILTHALCLFTLLLTTGSFTWDINGSHETSMLTVTPLRFHYLTVHMRYFGSSNILTLSCKWLLFIINNSYYINSTIKIISRNSITFTCFNKSFNRASEKYK